MNPMRLEKISFEVQNQFWQTETLPYSNNSVPIQTEQNTAFWQQQ